MVKYYTGVGARNTSKEILEVIRDIATFLAKEGYTLRSGGAEGADAAFEVGADVVDCTLKEIYIPWDGFQNRNEGSGSVFIRGGCSKALDIVSKVHPAWEKLSRGARALHARNVYQVLGKDLNTPSSFLICYAPELSNGQVKGGTNTAVQIARQNNIQVLNLYNENTLKSLLKRIGE